MEQLEALRAFHAEAKHLYEFASRLYRAEEAEAGDVEELDTLLSNCMEALSTLQDTVTDNDEEETEE